MDNDLQRAVFERDAYTCRGCKRQLPCVLDITPEQRSPRTPDYLVVDHIEGRSEDLSNLQSLCYSCNASKAGKGRYAFKISAALKQLGRCMTYYPSLAQLVGLKESIFLCQILYWSPRGRHEKGEGWIYKSAEEMQIETGLSYKEQIRLRRALVKRGLLEEMHVRAEHRLYFRVSAERLDALGEDFQSPQDFHREHLTNGKVPPDQRATGTCPKVSSYKEAEITAKITHKNQRRPQLSEVEINEIALRRLTPALAELSRKHSGNIAEEDPPPEGRVNARIICEQACVRAGVDIARGKKLLGITVG